MIKFDVPVGDRVVHGYDTRDQVDGDLVVFWHHGTPNIGSPPAPLFEISRRLGVRWLSLDRPGYGGSSPLPGRSVASVARDVELLADYLEIKEFAVLGHSGGGPHALACAALLPDRVRAAVACAGLAPFDANGLEWFDGMTESGVRSLRAAAAGREEKERFEAAGYEYDPEFTDRDIDALSGDWSWLNEMVRAAVVQGSEGLVDDDIAYVTEWGFEPEEVAAPTLILHGGKDRVVPSAHSEWLGSRCPNSDIRIEPDEGHISILAHAATALGWLRHRTQA